MRRYGQHEPSTRGERIPQRIQSLQVFGNMFQHVEHPDKFKGLSKRAVADVSLHQRPLRSLLGKAQAIEPQLHTYNLAVGARLAKNSEYVAGATPYLEHPVS